MKHMLFVLAASAALATTALAADDPTTLMTKRGKLLVSEDFAAMPSDIFKGGALASMTHGWRFSPGKWEIIDGALRGYQLKADKHSAAAFCSTPYSNAILQFDVKLDGCSQVVFCIDDPALMRPATPTRKPELRVEHLCRVVITKQGFSTQKDDHDHDGPDKAEPFGQVALPIRPGEWKTLVVELQGNEMVATMDGKTIAGTHPQVAAAKAFFSLGVSGYSNGFDKVPPLSASFRNLRIWEALPNDNWGAIKAKLPPTPVTIKP